MKQNGKNSAFASPGYVSVKMNGRQSRREPRRNYRVRIIKHPNNRRNIRNHPAGRAINFRARAITIGQNGVSINERRRTVNTNLRKFNGRNLQSRSNWQNRGRGRRSGNNRNNRAVQRSKPDNVTKEQLDMDLDKYMGTNETLKSRLDNELDDYFNKEEQK